MSRLKVLSLGAGVQSTTLAFMVAKGELPAVDCAIFADTQGEPEDVYKHLRWLSGVPYETWTDDLGRVRWRAVPGEYRSGLLPYTTHVVTRGDLWRSASTVRRTRDGKRTYISTGIPVYTMEGGLRKGIGRRQCTRTFKLEPIVKKCRELLGLKRVTSRHGVLVDMAIGISVDEADRMKPSRWPWIQSHWPLVELGMSRADCHAWSFRHGYPDSPRSACLYCPFRSDDSWLALRPNELAAASSMEAELQAAYAETSEFRGVPYLHDSRQPLAFVKLQRGRPDMVRDQLTLTSKFSNECEGMCGV